MTYECFEDLPVWQKAAELYELTEDLLENESLRASRGFRDQLDRAAEMQKELIRRLPAWHPKRKEAEADGLI